LWLKTALSAEILHVQLACQSRGGDRGLPLSSGRESRENVVKTEIALQERIRG